MKKQKNNIKEQEHAIKSEEEIVQKKNRFQNKYILLLKLSLVLIIVGCFIHYTDEQKYFNPDMEGAKKATYKRWDSFYKLTKNDSVDILILGNSHANCSINPKNLSTALGNISFVLAQAGADASDVYYNLEEALTLTTPKLCIVETFVFFTKASCTRKSYAISRMQNFSARKNTWLKLRSMPDLYEYDDYLSAWSPTIRNHEFIFRDTARINRNILLCKKPHLEKKVAFDTIPLYLGRMVRFQDGLKDSVLTMYKEKGAPIICTDTSGFAFQPQAEYFLQKTIDLCKEKNIPLLFLTTPMYHQHIENYQVWHDKFANHIRSADVKWYDLQLNYDTAAYTTACFEDTYDFNQHSTYYGSIITTYKLANYIHDSLDIELPVRYQSETWHKQFWDQEGYTYNCVPYVTDTARHVIARDQPMGDVHVKGIFWENRKTHKIVTIMLDKCDALKNTNKLNFIFQGKMKGEFVPSARVPASKVADVNPVHHYLYMVNVLKEFEPDSLIMITQ